MILSEAYKSIQIGESTLILVATVIDHGKILSEMASDIFDLDVPFIHGETPKDTRQRMMRELDNKKRLCLIANVVWREGINIRSLNHVINAAGQAKERVTLQSIGRGQRATKDKKVVKITDFIDPYKHLAHHTIQRIIVYAENGWLTPNGK